MVVSDYLITFKRFLAALCLTPWIAKTIPLFCWNNLSAFKQSLHLSHVVSLSPGFV